MPRARDLPSPPNWADFFTPGQYKIFLDSVERYWRGLGREPSIVDGVLHLPGPEEDEDDVHHLGLQNLSQVCNQCPMDDWPEIVSSHFETLASAQSDQEDLADKIEEFDAIKHLLAIRLYDASYLESCEDAWVYREDLQGTISALVFDLPTSIRQVAPSEAKAWDLPQDELFRIALENVHGAYSEGWDSELIEVVPGLKVTATMGDDFFAPTKALLFPHTPDVVGTHGALVGIPHRHVLLSYPIEDLEVVRAVNALIPVVLGMHQEGPGSLSSMLHWYRPGGGFVGLPTAQGDDGLIFTPPDEFVDLLNTLSADLDDDDDD